MLTAIKDRETGLFDHGYKKIIGLRDMYSEEYKKRSTVIDDQVSQDFLIGHQKTINKMTRPNAIVLYFAIMEFEAWLLSMYGLFPEIHPSLTLENIQNQRGYNIRDIDPQEEFFKPAKELDAILRLVGLRYQKSRDEVEMICSKIGVSDYDNAIENHRCRAFEAFFSDVSRYG